MRPLGPAGLIMARAMSEDQLLTAVTDLAHLFGLLVHHETDSRKSPKGLPDLIIVGRTVVWLELKSQIGRIRPEQQVWLERLTQAGEQARVIRPTDWLDGTVEQLLREIE